jgi:hypothetical protein
MSIDRETDYFHLTERGWVSAEENDNTANIFKTIRRDKVQRHFNGGWETTYYVEFVSDNREEVKRLSEIHGNQPNG